MVMISLNDVVNMYQLIHGLLIINECLCLDAEEAEDWRKRDELWRQRQGYEELYDFCEKHLYY